MKNSTLKLCLFFIIGALTLSSCNKDDELKNADIKSSFKAKVDNQPFNVVLFSGTITSGNQFGIFGADNQDQIITLDVFNFTGEKTYEFGLIATNGATFGIDGEDDTYTTWSENGGGSMTINSWNAADSLISGNFSFTAENDSGQTVSITEGAFNNVKIIFGG